MDDFSRFIVGHSLSESPSSDVATATLKAAIARHGKPESVRTDRGRTR
ncbi:MAG: transposase family protein [Deltaproteobacteria bacterium]|nr:transposase family protein [Deltaproteobacteria bacterium]